MNETIDDKVHTSQPRPAPHRLLIVALLILGFGVSGPLNFVMYLQGLPKGTGIRPMGWPIMILFYGLGTPAVILPILWNAISRHRLVACSTLYKRLTKSVALLISIGAFLPLVLSTFIAHSLVKSQELWLKP